MKEKRHSNISGVEIPGEIEYNDLSAKEKDTITNALHRGVTRREFMTWLTATGVTLASAGSIFTSAKTAMAATPKRGGKVKCAMATHGPNDTMDPSLATSTIDYTRHRIHYNSLVQLNDKLIPQPELAEEFSMNDSATEHTFKIRKDVVFHDGSKLTADDVVWSMRRHMGKDSKSVAKPLMAGVKEWKKVDSHTVKALLSSPDADFATVLGVFQFKIVKKDTADWQNPPGTGPFTLKEFKQGVRAVHLRNENYWREGPNLDQIQTTAITDSVARVNALLSGDMQLIASVDPKAIKQVESTPGVSVLSVPSGQYPGICCMTNTAPGNNPDFVMAMKLLQRRKRIVKSILKKQGTLGNDHPINIAYPDHCDTLAQRAFDPDKAKFHLKKSGVTQAELHVAEVTPGITDIVLMTQREASKIGLTLNVKRVPADGYWGAIWMKTPINVVVWNARPTANSMMSSAFAPDAPWNDTLWKNERMGELLAASRAIKDPVKRKEMYCEMQTIIHNESGMVIPAHINYVDGASDKVKGFPKVPLEAFGGCEWPEFAWLEG
ncbi:ABC transporter substrate-binding protein [Desulfococcaceae bacterium HSG9]|nr:ABC transporter substrate-binding protein [Desulfococcaceae bacterium HSG9]